MNQFQIESNIVPSIDDALGSSDFFDLFLYHHCLSNKSPINWRTSAYIQKQIDFLASIISRALFMALKKTMSQK